MAYQKLYLSWSNKFILGDIWKEFLESFGCHMFVNLCNAVQTIAEELVGSDIALLCADPDL